ncbi:hypothetical protein L7F22_008261 [Adiantum nelumboides]|nr:hypothetical protein [Adiantum nelumboides]
MEPVQVLGLGFFAWTAAFLVVRLLLPKRSHDFCNRVVSLLHVAVSLVLASLSVQDWHHIFWPLGNSPSPMQMLTMTVSLAYFVYDFFCCLFDTAIDYSNVIHHTVSISSLAYSVFNNKCGTEIVMCLWLSELSNPFMHARELLKELGLKDTTLALANDISFALVFGFARVVLGPYLVYLTVFADNPIMVKVGALGIQFVSIFWFYKIARMAVYKLSGGKKKPTKKL